MSERWDLERLAVLAHEVRSPVAALEALVEAARTATDPSLIARLVRLGVDAGRDVERLAADLELGGLEWVDVAVGELLGMCAALGAETEEVPSDWAIKGDPTRLRQALANVVANGLRHGTAVVVTALRNDGATIIEVGDNGPGVDLGLDLFARGVSGAGSSGYGLWLAREIARSHGGTLELVPVPAKGARFRFVLPSASAS
jgi:signal transduction histidine kinase